MKKLLLLFSLLLKFTFSGAQAWVYHPFPADSATWMGNHVFSDGSSYYNRIYLLGDTTISSVQYKKIFQTGSTGFTAGGYYPGPFSASNFIGGLRQDIPGKKIYFYSRYSEIESLLYDFSLSVGDTAFYEDQYPPYDTVVVSSIDSIMVGGTKHKVLRLQNLNQGNTYTTVGLWIEGVGSEAGLFERYTYGFEFSNQLDCFSVNNTRLYPYNSLAPYNCSYAVGIAELTNNQLKLAIAPNPVADNLHLVVNCEKYYNIEIINSKGDLVFRQNNLNENNSSFDFSNFSAGVYFVKLIGNSGQTITKKIVKQ